MDFIFKTKKSKIVRDYIGITIGTAIMALGISVFLMAAYVAPGGLMTVVPLKELVILQDMIKQIDKNAFIIIGNVHEVLGRDSVEEFNLFYFIVTAQLNPISSTAIYCRFPRNF